MSRREEFVPPPNAIKDLLAAQACEGEWKARAFFLQEIIASHADDRWEADELLTRLLNVRADCDRLVAENARLKAELAAARGVR